MRNNVSADYAVLNSKFGFGRLNSQGSRLLDFHPLDEKEIG